jgi:hypothetical protein
MNFIIAVSSCQKDRAAGDHDAIRDTWGRVADQMGIPYMIVMGGSLREWNEHEYASDTPDDYESLGLKTLWNIRQAMAERCDYLFQCFKDTYISIPRLVAASKELDGRHVVGNYFFHGIEELHPCGGSGYWLSRKAMKAILEADFSAIKNLRNAEDCWIGWALNEAGIDQHHDSRYDHLSMRGGVSLYNNNITNHLWTHYNLYQQNVMGFANWNNDWLRQEEEQERLGIPSEQNRRRRELRAKLCEMQGWLP